MSRGYEARSDEELAAVLATTRDEAACEELYRRYRKRIYLWCHSYSHDLDEAVDLTQEIFIKIFTRIDGYAGRARLSTWIYAIVQNHCRGQLSRQGTKWWQRRGSLDDLEVEDDRHREALREAEIQGTLDKLLARARDRMTEDELEAFVLHYRDGLTVNEITRTLGCTNLTGARTLIQNARRKFRRLTAGKKHATG